MRTPFQEIMAIPVPGGVCHRCGRTGLVKHYDFGLARIQKTGRDWAPTIAALIYSLLANILGRALGSLSQAAAL